MPSVQQVSSPSALTARTIVEHRRRGRAPSARATRRPCKSASRRCAFASRAARDDGRRGPSSGCFLDARVVALRLRAVAAILGAAAGLDRHQRRELDAVRRVMLAMRLLRAKESSGNGSAKSESDLIDASTRAPAGASARVRASRKRIEGDRTFGRWHCAVGIPLQFEGALSHRSGATRDCDYNRGRVSRHVPMLSIRSTKAFDSDAMARAAASRRGADRAARAAPRCRSAARSASPLPAVRCCARRARRLAEARAGMPGVRAAGRGRRAVRRLPRASSAVRGDDRRVRLRIPGRSTAAASSNTADIWRSRTGRASCLRRRRSVPSRARRHRSGRTASSRCRSPSARQRERGFNQAQEIAARVARATAAAASRALDAHRRRAAAGGAAMVASARAQRPRRLRRAAGTCAARASHSSTT